MPTSDTFTKVFVSKTSPDRYLRDDQAGFRSMNFSYEHI